MDMLKLISFGRSLLGGVLTRTILQREVFGREKKGRKKIVWTTGPGQQVAKEVF
jgi:hypothetical protein